nr:reverse transcriptase domain-containing protein [Tanacetum cinerariifolium]
MQNQLTNLTELLTMFVNSNSASTLSSGTLPSNTIANPRSDLKEITTRSGVSYDGPQIPPPPSFLPKVVENKPEATKDRVHPTNNESTKDVQPSVVQSKSLILTSEPVNSPTIEPVSSPVSARRPNLRPLISYPSRLQDQKLRDKANDQRGKFFQIFKDLNFNISFADALILLQKFGPSIKSLSTSKDKLCELARTPLNKHCSVVLLKKLPEKLGDPGKFLIPCDFLEKVECLSLADLGASINLMQLSVWNKLSLPNLSPACMTLELADRLISRPDGVAEVVYVKVGTFHFLADFVVVDFDADPRVPLILERSFLKTGRALIDVFKGELTLHVGKEAITFNLDQTSRYSANYNDMTAKRIDVIDMACEEYSQEFLSFSDVIASGNPTPNYNLIVSTTSPTLTSFGNSDFLLEEVDAFLSLEDDPTSPEVYQSYLDSEGDIPILKEFMNDDHHYPLQIKEIICLIITAHLEYAFLECDDKLPVIIAKYLSVEKKTALITVLKSHKLACLHRLSPFGLCNAPDTFQRCMMAIFHDMIKKTMEVFMDDFSVFRNSFQSSLSHLETMLKRCKDTNHCLNWEKSHFMVKEGIVLDHKIFKEGIEVDKAKVDVITKLPHPTTVKGIRNILGHAGFNRSDFAIGVVLGQRQDKHFKPTYYASKTMSKVESNYITTEKEMLAVVSTFEKFRSYLIMNKSIVYTDHSALKYLFAKKYSKARLLRWVLLLQEFAFKVIDTKGAENLAVDHLSRLENPHQNVLDPKEINESFLSRHSIWFLLLEERTKLNFGRCIGIHLAVVLGIDLLLFGLECFVVCSWVVFWERSGGRRGVKKKQHGLDGLAANGTDHVPNEDMNLERKQSELNKLGNTSRKDHDGINIREAFLDTTKNVKGTSSVNKSRNCGNGDVNEYRNEGLESSSNTLKNLGVNKDGVANVNVTSDIDVHSVMDGHANLHYENAGQTPSNSTSNPNKGTSYAKLFTGKSSRKSVNFRTLITPARNEIDVVVPLESVRASSERFVNTTYSFFMEKWVAYFIVANYVKIYDVLVTVFSEDGLSVIATKLVTSLMIDTYTSDMCMQSWGSSSTSTTSIVGNIDKVERLILWETYTLDDEGKPLKRFKYSSDHDSKDEVKLVDNEMASFLDLKRVGSGTNSLLEQLRELMRMMITTTTHTMMICMKAEKFLTTFILYAII